MNEQIFFLLPSFEITQAREMEYKKVFDIGCARRELEQLHSAIERIKQDEESLVCNMGC